MAPFAARRRPGRGDRGDRLPRQGEEGLCHRRARRRRSRPTSAGSRARPRALRQGAPGRRGGGGLPPAAAAPALARARRRRSGRARSRLGSGAGLHGRSGRRPTRRWSASPSSSMRCAATAPSSTSIAGGRRRPPSPPSASASSARSATSAPPPSSTRPCATRIEGKLRPQEVFTIPVRRGHARWPNEARPYRFFIENYDAVQKRLPADVPCLHAADRVRLLGRARRRRPDVLRRPETHGSGHGQGDGQGDGGGEGLRGACGHAKAPPSPRYLRR